MSVDKEYVQKLVQNTASLLKKAPMLTVPQAIRAANFSSAQSTTPSLQMRVRGLLMNLKFVADAPPIHVNFTLPMPTVSTLSSPPDAAASVAART